MALERHFCYNIMMNYDNFIWDLGGTLLDNYESSSHAFAATLWDLTETVILHDEAYQALKISTDFAIHKFAENVPGFLTEYKQLEAQALEHPVLFDGAIKTLSEIVKSDRKNFMISHRNNQVCQILKDAKIYDYFTDIITSDSGFPRKPEPNSIQYLLEKYDMNPGKTVMIGDRDLDIQAGKNAGVKTIFFAPNGEKNEAADQIIQRLEDLI